MCLQVERIKFQLLLETTEVGAWQWCVSCDSPASEEQSRIAARDQPGLAHRSLPRQFRGNLDRFRQIPGVRALKDPRPLPPKEGREEGQQRQKAGEAGAWGGCGFWQGRDMAPEATGPGR